MRAKQFEKKLVLNKKTISHLDHKEMRVLGGGFTSYGTCAFTCEPCPLTDYRTCYTGWCC
jgi:natural product precursor